MAPRAITCIMCRRVPARTALRLALLQLRRAQCLCRCRRRRERRSACHRRAAHETRTFSSSHALSRSIRSSSNGTRYARCLRLLLGDAAARGADTVVACVRSITLRCSCGKATTRTRGCKASAPSGRTRSRSSISCSSCFCMSGYSTCCSWSTSSSTRCSGRAFRATSSSSRASSLP